MELLKQDGTESKSPNDEPMRIGQWRHDCFPYDVLWYKGIWEGEEKMMRMTEWPGGRCKDNEQLMRKMTKWRIVQDPATPNQDITEKQESLSLCLYRHAAPRSMMEEWQHATSYSNQSIPWFICEMDDQYRKKAMMWALWKSCLTVDNGQLLQDNNEHKKADEIPAFLWLLSQEINDESVKNAAPQEWTYMIATIPMFERRP